MLSRMMHYKHREASNRGGSCNPKYKYKNWQEQSENFCQKSFLCHASELRWIHEKSQNISDDWYNTWCNMVVDPMRSFLRAWSEVLTSKFEETKTWNEGLPEYPLGILTGMVDKSLQSMRMQWPWTELLSEAWRWKKRSEHAMIWVFRSMHGDEKIQEIALSPCSVP